MLGNYYDTKFGSTHADILAQVNCPVGFKFPAETGLHADSASVVLVYYTWFGDKYSPLDVNIYEAAHKIRKAAFDAVHSFAAPELTCRLKKVMDILTGTECINIKDARRMIADKLIEDNTYRF